MASGKSLLSSQFCALEMGTLPRDVPWPIIRTFFSTHKVVGLGKANSYDEEFLSFDF